MARRVIAIPATSAAPEQLFCTAGSGMTKKRSRLTCDNMEELVYLVEVWPQVREWQAVKKMRLEQFFVNRWNTLFSMSCFDCGGMTSDCYFDCRTLFLVSPFVSPYMHIHIYLTSNYQGEVVCVPWQWPWQTSRHSVGSREDTIGKKGPRMNIWET